MNIKLTLPLLALLGANVAAALPQTIVQDFESFPTGTQIDSIASWQGSSSLAVVGAGTGSNTSQVMYLDSTVVPFVPASRLVTGLSRLTFAFECEINATGAGSVLMLDSQSSPIVGLSYDEGTGTVQSQFMNQANVPFQQGPVTITISRESSGFTVVTYGGNVIASYFPAPMSTGENPVHRIQFLARGFQSTTPTTTLEVDSIRHNQFTLGSEACSPNTNSTGQGAFITVLGSPFPTHNNITLLATGLPLNQFGFFLTSKTPDFVPLAGGSQGNLCLGMDIGRFNRPGEILSSGQSGSASLRIDLTAIPLSSSIVPVMAGDLWYYQCWYRDSSVGPTVSNFSQAVAVQYQ